MNIKNYNPRVPIAFSICKSTHDIINNSPIKSKSWYNSPIKSKLDPIESVLKIIFLIFNFK